MFRVLVYGVIICLFLVGYAKFIERRGVFFPSRPLETTPELINLSFEDVYLTTADGVKLNGWFIPGQQANYTVLFCHGNAGNISHRLDKIEIFNKLGLNTFIIDYRGYGNSAGTPSEAGVYQDGQAAYNYLVEERNIKPEQIILFGESLGCAVAIAAAAGRASGGLILEGAFSSGRDMARRLYPFIPSLLFAHAFNSLPKIKKITSPKLFIHSRDDEVVPFDLARKLYEQAPGPKEFVEIAGGHNEAFMDSYPQYTAALRQFIVGLGAPPSPGSNK